MNIVVIANFVALLSLTIIGCRSQECNSQRVSQCRAAIEDELQREGDNQLSTRRTSTSRTTSTNQRREMQIHCRSIADNLDCLVYQVSNCLSLEERERNSDPIYKAWRYLTNVCDSIVGWRISQCFQRDDLRRCESLNRDSSRNANVDNCRKFVGFKECVENIVKYQCPVEDRSIMTLYILDQGREKSWKCSSAESTRYHDDFQHHTLPLSDNGDAQDAICLARSSGNIRACSDRYYERQDEARRYRTDTQDRQDRVHKECCAALEFERCVRDTVRNYCSLIRDSVVQTILDQNGVRKDPRCQYYGSYECDGCATVLSSLLLSVFAIAFSLIRAKVL